MNKFIVGNQQNKDDQLAQTIVDAQDGDTIELMPGTYFSKESPLICTIGRNVTFIGQSTNKDDIKLNSSFTIGAGKTVIFKNLTITFPADSENTLSAYDGAKVYTNNVCINRETKDNWDTIYGQNATFSFKDTMILTGKKTKTIGLSLDQSQIFADNTSIQFLFQRKSQAYLKNSIVINELKLRQHSETHFNNLTLASYIVPHKKDLTVHSSSTFQGQTLILTSPKPQIRVHKAKFEVTNVQPEPNKLHFKFDKSSIVRADSKKPNNEDKEN
ncbi:hypothetical protein [Companilactobacillus furfuricola]|uniref:hypothetical protein n=1 Tax=Companilactobacillus furfuricola TaxID=1462575 RepID=UPI000F77B7CA|nr:hypothetical protein [Companilactobacillus furfuricola]